MAWFFYMLSRLIAKILFGLFAKTWVLHAERTNSSSSASSVRSDGCLLVGMDIDSSGDVSIVRAAPAVV